jgi:hypothetical protein
VNEKTQWDTNGPLLLGWWTTEWNFPKYRGGNEQTGEAKEAYWQMLSQLIKDMGILVE